MHRSAASVTFACNVVSIDGFRYTDWNSNSEKQLTEPEMGLKSKSDGSLFRTSEAGFVGLRCRKSHFSMATPTECCQVRALEGCIGVLEQQDEAYWKRGDDG